MAPGLPTLSLTRRQMRAVDRRAIENLGISGLVLMENAGRQVADAVEQFLGGLTGRSVAIVAGAGNNGGDGFVVARHLAIRGCKVATFLVAPEEKITGDALANLQIIRKLGLDIRPCAGPAVGTLADALKPFDAVLDAIGGTGITGALRGDTAVAVEQVNLSGKGVIAVDIPTGLDCDTGDALGPTIRAAVTVTFVARKKGFDNPASAAYTGRVIVADIGVAADY